MIKSEIDYVSHRCKVGVQCDSETESNTLHVWMRPWNFNLSWSHDVPLILAGVLFKGQGHGIKFGDCDKNLVEKFIVTWNLCHIRMFWFFVSKNLNFKVFTFKIDYSLKHLKVDRN